MNFGSSEFCGVYCHRSSQIRFGQLGHHNNVSHSRCRFLNSRRCDFNDRRGFRRLLQLLHAAAVHDLLPAAIRAAAIPHRRRDRDGVARLRRGAPRTGAVPHRDGAAARDGGAAERPVRAHPAAIRHAPARRDGPAGLFLLRPGADELCLLRVLSQASLRRIQAALPTGAPLFFAASKRGPETEATPNRASQPATPWEMSPVSGIAERA